MSRKFLQDDHPMNHINTTDNAFIREYMKIIAKYDPLWYQYQDSYPVIFQEVFSRTTLSANIPEDIISMAAVQLNEFIVTCYFGDNTCNRSQDFTTFFDPYYFNSASPTTRRIPLPTQTGNYFPCRRGSRTVGRRWC